MLAKHFIRQFEIFFLVFLRKLVLMFHANFHLVFSEASKVIMQYVAEVSGKGRDIDRVKEQLLQSNPVLEGTISDILF